MPTFAEFVGADRDLRVQPAFAPPLKPKSGVEDLRRRQQDEYDVLIVGAGPAGLFLKLLLSRYGLTDESVLCVDQKSSIIRTGQADGLQPRTLEVLESLGICHEILAEGCQLWEVGFWNAAEGEGGSATGGIERTSYAADVVVRARFPHEVTIHQGRVERILTEDLRRYSTQGVQYSTRFKDARTNETSNASFPLEVDLEVKDEASSEVTLRTIRAKHVVAADGAHSAVRSCAGLQLVGESRDYIWGVVDFVAETDFPDIRRRTAIHSSAGSAMVIPRERTATGEYLTRLYIQMDDVESPDEPRIVNDSEAVSEIEKTRQKAKQKRERIKLETLFQQAESVFRPYHIRIKEGREPDWWAAYQIGQRMTSAFSTKDESGMHRVFVAGDAAHTHSPKAGQGMNVSLMDSYNLAWKLAYHLLSLCPVSNTQSLLESYGTERGNVARALIDFDQRFSSMFSGKVGSAGHDTSGEPLTHDKFLEVFSSGSGFSSGCGIEYESSLAVNKETSGNDVNRSELPSDPSGDENSPWMRDNWPAAQAQALLQGALYPGRRLPSLRVIRHADSIPMELHEAFPSTGRFRILLLCALDLLDTRSKSFRIIDRIGYLIESLKHPQLLELVVVHPLANIRGMDWTRFPAALKKHAEMRIFCASPDEAPQGKVDGKMGVRGAQAEDGYSVLCVRKDKGAWAVIRPDGVVGTMGALAAFSEGEAYLRGLMVF